MIEERSDADSVIGGAAFAKHPDIPPLNQGSVPPLIRRVVLDTNTPSAGRGIFEATARLFASYRARIVFRDRIVGGVPKDPQVVDG
jgi:hypothetical protein